MGAPMMSAGMDPFASFRGDFAKEKTQELTEFLGLSEKQAKKVLKVYSHPDNGLAEEMMEMMQLMSGNGNMMGGGMPQMPQGGWPGMGGAPAGPKPEGDNAKPEDAKPEGMPKEAPERMGHPGAPGMPGGFPMMGGGMSRPKNIPVSEKERVWREKQMSKILTAEQYVKWHTAERRAQNRH